MLDRTAQRMNGLSPPAVPKPRRRSWIPSFLFFSVVILLVLVVSAVAWENLTSSYSHCCSSPIATVLVIGAPIQVVVPGHHWYNFSVAEVNRTIAFTNLYPQLRSPAGLILTPPSGILDVFSGPGLAGQYSFVSGTWTSGGGVQFKPGQSLSMDANGLNLTGGYLVGIAAGSFGGTYFTGTITVLLE